MALWKACALHDFGNLRSIKLGWGYYLFIYFLKKRKNPCKPGEFWSLTPSGCVSKELKTSSQKFRGQAAWPPASHQVLLLCFPPFSQHFHRFSVLTNVSFSDSKIRIFAFQRFTKLKHLKKAIRSLVWNRSLLLTMANRMTWCWLATQKPCQSVMNIRILCVRMMRNLKWGYRE